MLTESTISIMSELKLGEPASITQQPVSYKRHGRGEDTKEDVDGGCREKKKEGATEQEATGQDYMWAWLC